MKHKHVGVPLDASPVLWQKREYGYNSLPYSLLKESSDGKNIIKALDNVALSPIPSIDSLFTPNKPDTTK
jgi:hypothetical protein